MFKIAPPAEPGDVLQITMELYLLKLTQDFFWENLNRYFEIYNWKWKKKVQIFNQVNFQAKDP